MNHKVFVGLTDTLNPITRAMTMARYSRDVGSVVDRLPTGDLDTAESKDRANVEKYYIKYGHKSVGQLATVDIYIENISQLAAIAIDNNRLYNGQQSSTRYIGYSSRPLVYLNERSNEIQKAWVVLYNEALVEVRQKLVEMYPYEENNEMGERVYKNTIDSQTLDRCRGLLPAGITTNLAFTGTFDLINDHFGSLLHHPLDEVKEIARNVLTELKGAYAEAVLDIDTLTERFKYMSDKIEYYYTPLGMEPSDEDRPDVSHGAIFWFILASNEDIKTYLPRGKYQTLPKHVFGIGCDIPMKLYGQIDFGSFRDLHRHRNGLINMPILGYMSNDVNLNFIDTPDIKDNIVVDKKTRNICLNRYYTELLSDKLKEKCASLLSQTSDMSKEGLYVYDETNSDVNNAIMHQYIMPMGVMVEFEYRCDLNQLLYLLELRTDKTVHQTLRKVMLDIGSDLFDYCPILEGNIHMDTSEDNFTLKRGTQTYSDLSAQVI